MNYSIGVDVGGTNIRLAIVDELGNIVKVVKQRTRKVETPSGLVDQIVDMYHEIDAGEYHPIGMGVGVPGPTQQSTGHVYVLSNLGLGSFNLKDMLEARLNIRVVVGNDAKVAALAEGVLGAGQGAHVMQYITISTGIGGGLVIDGKLFYSSLGFSQEIGNMLVDKEGDQPNPSMSRGCLEGLCAGTAIVKAAKKNGLEVAHAGEFFELAASGNEIAKKLREEWIDNMARGIGTLVNVLEPDLFVLGGGVIQSSEYFLEDLRKKVNDFVFSQMKDKVVIKLAHFDQDAGIIGASLLTR